MPVEVYLVSREPMTLDMVVRAALVVDDQLVPLRLCENGPVQLVDCDDVAVLTVDNSRPLADTRDLQRLLGPLPADRDLWWTEATAPWTAAGAVGIEIARGIGRLLHARIQVEDGRD